MHVINLCAKIKFFVVVDGGNIINYSFVYIVNRTYYVQGSKYSLADLYDLHMYL